MIKDILENKEIRNFIIELVTRGGAILIALFVLYIMYADRMSDKVDRANQQTLIMQQNADSVERQTKLIEILVKTYTGKDEIE